MSRAWWFAGAGIASGAAAWWYFGRERFDIIDEIGDAVVELTSTDEARLAQLGPATQAAARELIAQLAQQGIGVKVGQTLRTPAQEKAAIDAGRSAVKTHSWHEIGRALDLYPIDPATGSADLDGVNVELFRQMHEIAAAVGFRGIAFNDDGSKRYITNSAGKKIWDGGHLEWRSPYGSIAEAVASEGAAYGIA
jgi:hypothetical protein